MTQQLPGSLRSSPSFVFVGRARELDALRTLLPRAPGEGRGVALIAGEPGSGKSRLVRELARELAQEGTLVLYGACDSAVRAPYRPFVDALEQLVRRSGGKKLVELPPGSGSELARLLPELAPPADEIPAAASVDPDTARHRLHVAIADVLAAASSSDSLLLVVEDLHWADSSTLLLLRHLAQAGGDARMLLVATYRDAEADLADELADTLVDVGRTEGVVRVRLGGLSLEEIAEFVRSAAGIAPADELVTVLGDLTAGNPFLLTELWRELLDRDSVEGADGVLRLARPAAELGTPDAVRAVVSQRLARLDASTAAVLELAAVAGAQFELDTLRRSASLEEGGLLDAVDEAERSGLIVEAPSTRLAYRFAHELVRRSVIDRLSAPRRAELHLRVAEALEGGQSPADERARVAALAHHFAAAAPVGGAERAVAYNLLAARSASAAFAFDEATERLRTALALGVSDPVEQAAAYLELGDASHRAGRSLDALEAFRRTADLARSVGDAELLARAAIGFEEACWRPGIYDAGSVERLREAAAVLGDEDSELRTRLLGGLARARPFPGRHAGSRDRPRGTARHP